jgi:hypothetical protein
MFSNTKDDIIKGGYNVEGGGRESYASNKGSEANIKEAIRSLEMDKGYQEQIKKLSMEKN